MNLDLQHIFNAGKRISKMNFFSFRSKLISSSFHARVLGLGKDERETAHEWNLVKGEYSGITFPVVFNQNSGKILNDILDTGWPGLFLISSRLKSILEDNQLTGWRPYPIRLYDQEGSEVLGYYGFSVTGRCGPIDYAKSEIIEKRRVPTGPICRFYKGEFIDVDRWDKSDFFSPEGTYQTYITQKVADILKKNKITNLELERLSDKEISVNVVK